MSKRRAKRRGGTLSVSIIVIAFLVVMVVQVVQTAKAIRTNRPSKRQSFFRKRQRLPIHS